MQVDITQLAVHAHRKHDLLLIGSRLKWDNHWKRSELGTVKNAKIVNVNQEGRVCIYRGRVIYLAGRTAEPHDRGAERERGGGVRVEQKVHDNAEHSNANENRRRNYRPGCVQLVPVTHKQQIGMGNRVSSHSIRAINKREGKYQLAALHYTVSIRHRRNDHSSRRWCHVSCSSVGCLSFFLQQHFSFQRSNLP